MKRRGFTLIEVMVAMAILAMGMTIILSSQAGLFATAKRVQDETYASNLLRCKMNEIELDLVENGYPLIEQNDSGECCEDEDSDYTCEWTIQTVELPQPSTFADIESDTDGGSEEALDPFVGSPLSDAAALLPASGTGLTGIESTGDLADTLGGATEGGGMVGMALSLVYPTLKPMLEASIRKVNVAVVWQEGSKERRLEAIQYVTNPLEGNLNPNLGEELDALTDQLGSSLTGATGTPGDDANTSSDPQPKGDR